ncbi:MAG: hypothetical protein RQ966_04155 [Acetobacteraceae bacterium]|nr:hypothetical protein [Acetobacteraceae bacterium]
MDTAFPLRPDRAQARRLRLQARRAEARLRVGVGVPRGGVLAALTLLGGATALGGVLLSLGGDVWAGAEPSALRAGRRLNRAAGALAGSVLFDSALEHYAGAFENKAMYTPLVVSTLSLIASLHGHADRKTTNHPFRDAIYSATALTGIVGTGFHIYNVGKRPGGFCFQNLFYAAPLGAPAALVLSGLMGFLGERARDNAPGSLPTIFGLTAGRLVAAVTGLGLVGTAAEAGLLHLRGAYHNPAMLLPVTIPPIAGLMLARTALKQSERRPVTRWWMRMTALLGLAGAGFHSIGVARNMGGWRNWTQNILAGPPIPAPPAFTGLALAGLAALGLQQDHPDD